MLRSFNLVRRFEAHPAEMAVASFVLTALTGSALLMLPVSMAGEPISWVDAFFTATSAVCVTGLASVDTGTRFTVFGQTVIMVLIQLGGLGIMTINAIFMIYSGRRISLSGRLMMESTFMPRPEQHVYSMIRTIVLATMLIESTGAVIIYILVPESGGFRAIFHAVSAFCNAGFSTYPDNLMSFRGNLGMNLVITALIILGGLGFYVLFDCYYFLVQGERRKLSLHTKLVLVTTICLIVAGTAGFYFFESRNLLRDLPPGEKLLASYFQSVTPRTAGFNTVDLGRATQTSLLFIIMLMFIGASPGSTGGGIKTTTFAIIAALGRSKLKGRSRVEIFKASVSEETVARALSVTLMAAGIIVLALLLALQVETGDQPYAKAPARFVEYCFEVVSAFGTVGLSTGITPQLGDFFKLLLCAVMFIGRVGPLTIAHAVGRKKATSQYRYAEEQVMIG